MPAGYGKEWQAARRLALVRAGHRCERCARRPPEVALIVHHVDGHGVGGRRAFDQTNLVCSVGAIISLSTAIGDQGEAEPSCLSLLLHFEQGGSQASAGPDVEFKRKRYCCSRDALLARQSRMQLGAGHDLEIRPAIVAIMSVNDTRTT